MPPGKQEPERLLLACFDGNDHSGRFLEAVYWSTEDPYGASHVVRWCRCCGAMVVDEDVDGRHMRIVTKMRWPSLILGADHD